ncbi:MAG: hypothetical protein O2990_07795 [Bacteroidetes bacterium]|nr:hypothetical protein [Bacteroidota bacterium]
MKKNLFRYSGLILLSYAAIRTGLLLSQDTGMTEGELGQIIGFLILGAVGLGLFAAGRK